MACADVSYGFGMIKNDVWLCCVVFVSLFLSANHRRAGNVVTNILAKELMQEDKPSSGKPSAKKLKSDDKVEPKLEEAESLEDLLEAATSRSN